MIRIGVIGAGNNGCGHARYYHQSPRAEVVAVAETNPERAQSVASELGIRTVSDFTEFLDDVDAVVISSPNFLHRDQAVACARAGKHVYCEKPMGLSAEQADEIADAIKQAGVCSCVGFSVSFSEPIQTMLRYLREGRVGKLFSVFSRRMTLSVPDPGHWRADHTLSGGLLFEINVHEIEWMMRVGGTVKSVYGRTWAAPGQKTPRANDHLWVTLNFAEGAVGLHEGSQRAPCGAYVRAITGTEGALTTDRWGKDLFYARAGEREAKIDCDPRFDLRGHFLDCIEHGVQPVADAEWGRKVMAVAEAVIQSAISGEVVEVGA